MDRLEPSSRKKVESAMDSDDLVRGLIFDDIEQEHVRIGSQWVGTDRRLPWQLLQFCRNELESWDHLRLRLDLDVVEPTEGHLTPLRKAHWWGAPFSWDRLESMRQGFETTHGDEGEVIARIGMPRRANFRWNFPREESVGEFQIEEFTAKLGASRSSAYLHSILDLRSRRFVHVDGAVKTYRDDGEFLAAYERAIQKASLYEKLFRLDAAQSDGFEIQQELWMSLVATYFWDSRLVEEYFET